MLMVDNTSIMAHHDAELEGGGDHLIDRLLASPDRICYHNGHTAFSPATTDIALTDPKADPFPEYGFGEEDGASFRIGLPQNP